MLMTYLENDFLPEVFLIWDSSNPVAKGEENYRHSRSSQISYVSHRVLDSYSRFELTTLQKIKHWFTKPTSSHGLIVSHLCLITDLGSIANTYLQYNILIAYWILFWEVFCICIAIHLSTMYFVFGIARFLLQYKILLIWWKKEK